MVIQYREQLRQSLSLSAPKTALYPRPQVWAVLSQHTLLCVVTPGLEAVACPNECRSNL